MLKLSNNNSFKIVEFTTRTIDAINMILCYFVHKTMYNAETCPQHVFQMGQDLREELAPPVNSAVNRFMKELVRQVWEAKKKAFANLKT